MDPNETLRRIQALLDVMMADTDLPQEQWQRLALELAELVEALHGWVTNGGFLPDAWLSKSPKKSRRVYTLAEGHEAVGDTCAVCEDQFIEGDTVSLVETYPADAEAYRLARDGQMFLSAAVLVHTDCKEKPE